MPLELRKTSQWWYGRYQAAGKIHCINLGLRVAGRRPATLSETGDTQFERSRGRAQEALDRLLLDVRRQKTEEQILEQLYKLRTGHDIRRVRLSDLIGAWENIPRKRRPTERYSDQCRSILTRFHAFMTEHHPHVSDITQVTKTMTEGFLNAEEARQISNSTWNDILKTVRGAFRHTLPAFHSNPFTGIPLRETHTIHRKPYSAEELKIILDAARGDDFVRPLVVTAMCTAMRRGDCCLLKWSDVDLVQRFITVKTSKTGETVEIPIFPLLYDELTVWVGKSDIDVFPEQAKMFRTNPDGISYRIGRVLHKAGFVPQARIEITDGRPSKQLGKMTKDQVSAIAREKIGPVDGSTTAARKKQKMLEALDLYLNGCNLNEVAAALDLSKGCASNYLNHLEDLCGVEIIRRRDGNLCQVADIIGPKQELRQRGKRKASLRDFHSFRVTWITLALSAGVPLELVKRVTGHRTADVVLRHYFKPDRANFSRTLNSAMPSLLQGECGSETKQSKGTGK